MSKTQLWQDKVFLSSICSFSYVHFSLHNSSYQELLLNENANGKEKTINFPKETFFLFMNEIDLFMLIFG